MEFNKEQVEGLRNDLIQSMFGMSYDAFQKHQDEIQQLLKQAKDGERLVRQDYAHTMMPKAFEAKCGALIKDDKHDGLGLPFGRIAHALMHATLEQKSIHEVAKEWGEPWITDSLEQAAEEMKQFGDGEGAAKQKNLLASSIVAGGATVPVDMSSEMIPILRAMAVVRQFATRLWPIPSGQMIVSRHTADPVASYIAEGTAISESSPTFDRINLLAKKLMVVTALSNTLIRTSMVAIAAMVRDFIGASMALREDLAFIRGDGSVNTPTGLRNLIATANVNARTQVGATSTLAEITNDLADMVCQVQDADVATPNGFWIMRPRTWWGLWRIRDADGAQPYKEELNAGNLMGFPIGQTTQLPINLGSGDETELYFQEGSEVMLADTMRITIEAFRGGAYNDSTGTVVAGISRDETVLQGVAEHDFNVQHDLSGSVLTAVDWGV